MTIDQENAGKEVSETPAHPEKSVFPARPGALRGQIRIADNFDTLPDDIAAAFGMNEVAGC